MGLFDFLKKNITTEKPSTKTIDTLSSYLSSSEIKVRETFIEATNLYSKKDYIGAISALNEAYTLVGKDNCDLDRLLRLPMYLQKAGEFDAAEKEFNLLLNDAGNRAAREFSRKSKKTHLSFAGMNRHSIYNKMRIAYSREKKDFHAAIYQLLSHAAWCQGLFYQDRKKELRSEKSKSNWKIIIDDAFNTSDLKPLRDKAFNLCLHFSITCLECDFTKLEEDLCLLLKKQECE